MTSTGSGGAGCGDSYTEEDAAELFAMLRQFMQKNEDWEVDRRSHKEFIWNSIRGHLFQRGDMVESQTTGPVVVFIAVVQTNYYVTEDGIMFKNFIYDVELV